MRIGVVGLNHTLAQVQLREQLAKACGKWFSPPQARHGASTFVLLSTCNRTEVYFTSDDLTETHSYLLNLLRSEIEKPFEQRLYSYFGRDCFRHLVRVTLGFDSAIFGETEIQGQVRLAYENGAEYHALPHELHFLFQKSLGVAKKIRSEFPLRRNSLSLEQAVLQAGKESFQELHHSRVLFVGASEINRKLIRCLKAKGFKSLTLCNRSDKLGKQLADAQEIAYLPWSELDQWVCYDWVIFATKSPHYLVAKEELDRPMACRLILDLSVPRNVEPPEKGAPMLWNIDRLNALQKTKSEEMAFFAALAERRVNERVDRHLESFHKRVFGVKQE